MTTENLPTTPELTDEERKKFLESDISPETLADHTNGQSLWKNLNADTAISCYVMREVKAMSYAEITKLTGLSFKQIKDKAATGFQLLTISREAPFILEIKEKLWRPLYYAGYKSKEQIREDILNGTIHVTHEIDGNRGSIRGIGRAALYALKLWLGIEVYNSKRARGARGHEATGRSKDWWSRAYYAGDPTVHNPKANNKVLAIRSALRFKHNQSTVYKIMATQSRKSQFSFAETASILGISKSYLRQQIYTGAITRDGRNKMFTRSEIMRWAAYNLNGWVLREVLEKNHDRSAEQLHALGLIDDSQLKEVNERGKDGYIDRTIKTTRKIKNPWTDMVS